MMNYVNGKKKCFFQIIFKILILKNDDNDPWHLGRGTWNKYLKKLKPHFVISHAYGQHVLTKVAQIVNIDVFK